MMDGLASVPHLLLQLARIVAIILAFLVPVLAVVWWLNRRDRRQREVQAQIWDLERQIREEAMSEEERHLHRQWRQQQADIAREARRRLGLPEEER
jgi:type II secretory pathway pseudopilin PulG